MAYYVLDYAYVDDYLERRDAYRQQHLALIREAHQRGEITMAGAMPDAPPRGLLIWQTEDPAVVENFAKQDPYVVNGLVTSWTVRPWNVVVP